MNTASKKDFFAACLVTALIVTALWQLLPPLEKQKPAPDHPAPRITYVPTDIRNPALQSGLQAIWSPALVALPARLMMRGLPRNERPQLNPTLNPLHVEPRYLKTKGANVRHIDEILPNLFTMPTLADKSFVPRVEENFSFQHSSSRPIPEIIVKLSPELRGKINVPEFHIENTGNQFQSDILVRFDRYGKVRSAILDTPTDDKDLNNKIIRETLKCFVEEPDSELSGRITIFYPGKI